MDFLVPSKDHFEVVCIVEFFPRLTVSDDTDKVANATIRPAGGIAGAIAHPVHGLWKSVQSPTAQKQERRQREVRISDGVEAVQRSTPAQKNRVIQTFKQLKAGTKERQTRYKDIAEAAMYGKQNPSNEDSEDPVLNSAQSQRTTTGSPTRQQVEDEETDFVRDLEIAKQLSLAEQRGYEQALAQMKRPEGTT